MRFFHLLFMMILTGYFLSAAPAYACKCMRADVTAESAANYPYIFKASVHKPVAHIGEKYIQTTVLRVQENFKGDASGDLLPLHNKGSCAFQFEEGKTYLVFAKIDGEIHVSASLCSPTRVLENDTDIPDFLRELNNAQESTPEKNAAQPMEK
ncbi:MAG: hypothetical protein EP349_07710 [Alphaproteobacteria bacterium]|nr:MAG: hypothetical protein EP349_07710 [Alphaproteobacteria bacterium]